MDDDEGYDDSWWESFDADAAYYQEEPDEHGHGIDPEEYDEAYASYVDAHKCFNDLKLSRGFLPVVALQDSGPSSSSTSSQKPFKGMGKGKKGKGKGTGKSSTYRYDRPPAKPTDPKGRARAALAPACMRCGSTSHKTAQCTQTSSIRPNRLLRQAANAKQSRVWPSCQSPRSSLSLRAFLKLHCISTR